MRKFKKLDSNIIFENQLSKDIPGLKKEALSSNSKSDRDKYINDIFNLFYEIHDKFEDLNIFYILLTSNIV